MNPQRLKASRLETQAVHAARPIDGGSGAVTPSITLSTTFERAPDGSFPHGHIYTRSSNPNRAALEQALALLEGGARAFAFGSGMAATAGLLQALATGDHLLLPDDLYHGTRHLVNNILARWGLLADFVDLTDLDRVAAAVRPTTRLVWAESPSNPLLKIVDIAALAQIAHAAGALLAVDNTWATPILQQPLALGADVVMHATTKYFGGHSDVLGGCLVLGDTVTADFTERIATVQALGGGVPSPFDCWLLQRSLPTLPLRVRAQSATAALVADFLAQHPAVSAVHYPGLATHPGHAIAMRQMRAGGAMLSFEVAGGAEAALAVAAQVEIFTRATSLGGIESLIEHRASIEGTWSTTPPGLLRVSLGLEHVDDLIADLTQALAAARR